MTDECTFRRTDTTELSDVSPKYEAKLLINLRHCAGN